jgi:hypothetical protein
MIDDLHEKLEMKYREPPWRLGECIARPIEKLDTAQFNRKKSFMYSGHVVLDTLYH